MRITIDIDDKDLLQVQELTGIRKRAPAVRHAVKTYLEEMAKKRFLQEVLAGHTDYPFTNEELEAMGSYDAD